MSLKCRAPIDKKTSSSGANEPKRVSLIGPPLHRLNLAALLIEAGSAEDCRSEPLSLFNAGLVERIDAVQLSCERRCRLEKEKERAEVHFIEPRNADRQVRSPIAREGEACPFSLGVEDLLHAEPREVLKGAFFARDDEILRGRFDLNEGDEFIPRPLHEELHLGVLIGCPNGGQRRGPNLEGFTSATSPLTEALGPELNEPSGKWPECVGIGHQNMDGAPMARMVEVVERSEKRCGVLADIARLGELAHPIGSIEQRVQIEAEQCPGKKAHRGEHAESAADIGRDREGAKALFLCERSKGPLLRIRDDERALAKTLFAYGPPKDVPGDEEARGRLDGAAGFTRRNQEGLAWIEAVK